MYYFGFRFIYTSVKDLDTLRFKEDFSKFDL